MVTINIEVNGGVAPIPITLDITNLDTDAVTHFSSPGSFQESPVLPSGSYTVNVCGQNPEGGYTDISVAGNFTSEPLPYSQTRCDTEIYDVFIYIEI